MAALVRRSSKLNRHGRIVPVNTRLAVPILVALMIAHLCYTIAVINSTGLLGSLQGRQFSAIESVAVNRLNTGGDRSLASVGWYLEAWHIAYVYYVPLSLFLYRQRQISKRALLFVFAYAGVSSLVLFSRVHFVMLLVWGLVTWVLLFEPPRRRVVFTSSVLLLAAVFMFISMQVVLSHVDFNNKTVLNDQLATYSVGSVLSFQELLHGNYHQDNPHNALYVAEGFYYVLGKLSLLNASEYPIGFRAFVFVPHPSNVYTFLDAFALDFGIPGILLGPFLMGLGMAWIYNRVRLTRTYTLVLLYGLCVYSCSVASLANFLCTPPVLVFLGTVAVLRAFVSRGTRQRTAIERA
jgi:oligosaccharide repeat unit polymerase